MRFCKKNDLRALALGKYSLQGNDFVNVFDYTTKPNDGSYEAHKKYVDIHYVIQGEERVFYADSVSQITQAYDGQDDYYLGTVKGEKSDILNNERVVIFETDEPHKAGVVIEKATYVKKAVFKVEI